MCIRNSQKLNTPRSNIFNKWILILYKIIDPVGDENFWGFLRRIKGLYFHCDFLYLDLGTAQTYQFFTVENKAIGIASLTQALLEN